MYFDHCLFSTYWWDVSSFSGSVWFMSFFSTFGDSFSPLGFGYKSVRFFNLVG